MAPWKIAVMERQRKAGLGKRFDGTDRAVGRKPGKSTKKSGEPVSNKAETSLMDTGVLQV